MANSIGILGFGVVGKSVFKFLSSKDSDLKINIFDERDLNSQELEEINSVHAQVFDNNSIKSFINNSQNFFVSPGFKLKNLPQDIAQDKLLCELDLFSKYFKKNSVAVTGSLGKTTITSFLANFANQIPDLNNNFKKTSAGGNIGLAMLELIEAQNNIDLAFIELSSFQLKLNKFYAPDIAIFNNFYCNHLDWHINLQDYFESKCKIFEYQKEGQYFIFNSDLFNELPEDLNAIFVKKLLNLKSQICCISKDFDNTLNKLSNIGLKNFNIFSIERSPVAAGDDKGCAGVNNNLIFNKIINNKLIEQEIIFELAYLPNVSFEKNWRVILATLYLLKFNLNKLKDIFLSQENFYSQENLKLNRLELFATINNVDFYNDSKSTVYQATQEAVSKLAQNNKPIILILGGLSKGVDRTPLVTFLKNIKQVKTVFCFGKDCANFSCYDSFAGLQDVVDAVFKIMQPGDQVLFSPTGSSFDLFKDYKYRGQAFKDAVLNKKMG
ncbi:MAG: UDP-N-acetylmuramoylalanine-D-glutamate ligase [candidate division TM6 bacterium GW2011_GWF2_28_16]|nr:MAG: UDP-N-acetylmuramoylalanine-D-glutamate ligase [candidate division TM6 bacterium GW2011_GWF2_28_16]